MYLIIRSFIKKIPARFKILYSILPSHLLILPHYIHFFIRLQYNTCIIVHIFSPNIFINWSQITFSFTYIACEKKDKIGIPQRIKLFIAILYLFMSCMVVLTWKTKKYTIQYVCVPVPPKTVRYEKRLVIFFRKFFIVSKINLKTQIVYIGDTMINWVIPCHAVTFWHECVVYASNFVKFLSFR